MFDGKYKNRNAAQPARLFYEKKLAASYISDNLADMYKVLYGKYLIFALLTKDHKVF